MAEVMLAITAEDRATACHAGSSSILFKGKIPDNRE